MLFRGLQRTFFNDLVPFRKSKQNNCSAHFFRRAANETRTRDPDLGKVVLYQLSYCRIAFGKSCYRMLLRNIKRTIASALRKTTFSSSFSSCNLVVALLLRYRSFSKSTIPFGKADAKVQQIFELCKFSPIKPRKTPLNTQSLLFAVCNQPAKRLASIFESFCAASSRVTTESCLGMSNIMSIMIVSARLRSPRAPSLNSIALSTI